MKAKNDLDVAVYVDGCGHIKQGQKTWLGNSMSMNETVWEEQGWS